MKTTLLVLIIVAIIIGIIFSILGIFHYRDAYVQNCEAGGGFMTGFLSCTKIIEDFATKDGMLADLYKNKHYEIKITGMKDVYLVGEPYSFSYVLSGYGNPCGQKKIIFPDQNGDTMGVVSSSSCIDSPMTEFVYDAEKETGTKYGNTGIKKPGIYNIGVEFERGIMEPTQGGHTFHVVETICNENNAKTNAQCFAESYNSCKSAYITQQFPADDGGMVSLVAVIESWNDCQLRVYTENSLGAHTLFHGVRSICEKISIGEDSLNFENCNNANYPSILLN